MIAVAAGSAATFLVLGLVCGWLATQTQRLHYWTWCGIACCGMWVETLLLAVMLTHR